MILALVLYVSAKCGPQHFYSEGQMEGRAFMGITQGNERQLFNLMRMGQSLSSSFIQIGVPSCVLPSWN